MENHSSKHSREKGGSERGWDERWEGGERDKREQERRERVVKREKRATGAPATNKLKLTSIHNNLF